MKRIHQFMAITIVAIVTWGIATKTTAEPEKQRSDIGWPGFNGGYDATRFSALMQINVSNVASLQEIARFKIPETMSFQSDPVIVGDTIYVTTRVNTYSIDARSGQQRWVRHHDLKSESPGRLGRGVAYDNGRLFRGLVDGHLLALDAKSGDVIGDVVAADIKAGEFYTAAPIVWEGRVFIGN